MVKICLCCGEEFSKPYVESKRVWVMRHKFCSRQCADTDKLGKNVIDISGQRFGRLIVLAQKVDEKVISYSIYPYGVYRDTC